MKIFSSEEERRTAFPVCKDRVFVGHAGVTALPQAAASAMQAHIAASCSHHQEFGEVLKDVQSSRTRAGAWIGKSASEVALIGPTSLGLSLFANGIQWAPGDEILVYHGDYPANVYPWMEQERRGAKIVYLQPEEPGKITLELVEAALTPRTRLVALASCHFLTGWRIDIDGIGQLLKRRGVLFSLDAIQTLGAFPTPAANVDFLSADAHKWMLGPLAVGIVAVAKEHFETCRPTLLGAWNVESPDFLTQKEIRFVPTAQRYEPGVLNITGIYGMLASLDLLESVGRDRVAAAILQTRDHLEVSLEQNGWEFLSPRRSEPLRSGILTARHPGTDVKKQFAALESAGIVASLRTAADKSQWLRFSPHFYNTIEEMDRVLDVLLAR